MKTVYIVTLPFLGWDCIVGCFSTSEEALKCSIEYGSTEDRACIFEQEVLNKFEREE